MKQSPIIFVSFTHNYKANFKQLLERICAQYYIVKCPVNWYLQVINGEAEQTHSVISATKACKLGRTQYFLRGKTKPGHEANIDLSLYSQIHAVRASVNNVRTMLEQESQFMFMKTGRNCNLCLCLCTKCPHTV